MEDFKDLSPENYPRAAKLFKHEFFWDCTDDLAPFGNDSGADTLAFLQEWRAENPDGEPLDFLEDLLASWNVSNSDWDVVDSQTAQRLLEDDEFSFVTRDDVILALAFGLILLDSTVETTIKERALLAIQRQSLPNVIEDYCSSWVPERLERLQEMRAVLMKL